MTYPGNLRIIQFCWGPRFHNTLSISPKVNPRRVVLPNLVWSISLFGIMSIWLIPSYSNLFHFIRTTTPFINQSDSIKHVHFHSTVLYQTVEFSIGKAQGCWWRRFETKSAVEKMLATDSSPKPVTNMDVTMPVTCHKQNCSCLQMVNQQSLNEKDSWWLSLTHPRLLLPILLVLLVICFTSICL